MKFIIVILSLGVLTATASAKAPDTIRADGMKLHMYCETFADQEVRTTLTKYSKGGWQEEITINVGDKSYVNDSFANPAKRAADSLVVSALGMNGFSTHDTGIPGVSSAQYEVRQIWFTGIEKDGSETKYYALVNCYTYFWR